MNDKLKIISGILGQYRTSGQELLFSCPYCGHHKLKLSVNIDKNVFKCWVCDTRGKDLYRIVKRYGTFKDVQEWRVLSGKVDITGFEDIFKEEEEFKEEIIDLPAEFTPLANQNYLTARTALNYLNSRGITKKDILMWKIGYCDKGEYSKRIIVPSFSMVGKPNFFIARSYCGDWKRYKNPKVNRNIIFNELYVDWNKDIILVEGTFDAIRASYIGSAIPLLGSTLRVESKLFQHIVRNESRVFLALDGDAKKKEMKLATILIRYGIEIYQIDTSGYEDVAEMPVDILQQRKDNAMAISTKNQLYELIRNV